MKSLTLDYYGGVAYVRVQGVLDALEAKVQLCHKQCATPGLDPITTEFLRGRAAELNNLAAYLVQLS